MCEAEALQLQAAHAEAEALLFELQQRVQGLEGELRVKEGEARRAAAAAAEQAALDSSSHAAREREERREQQQRNEQLRQENERMRTELEACILREVGRI